MSKRAKGINKTGGVRRGNSAPRVRKTYLSQSKGSPVEQVLHLQQTIGNQAVQRLFKSGVIQTKLKIGKPNDKYEQEADRVAEQVIRILEPKVRRQPDEERKKKEELIQTKPISEQITPLVRRQVEDVEKKEREEEMFQAKEDSGGLNAAADVSSSINSLRGGGQPLPETVRSYFEPRFSSDFSGVRIHTESKASETAKAINARAFTVGKDVVFGPCSYSPETEKGKKLLAHELTHVMQQASASKILMKESGNSSPITSIRKSDLRIARAIDNDEEVDEDYVKDRIKKLYESGLRDHFHITDKLVLEDPQLRIPGFDGSKEEHRKKYFKIDREMVGPVLRNIMAIPPQPDQSMTEVMVMLESGMDKNSIVDTLWQKKFNLEKGTTYSDIKKLSDEQRMKKGLPSLKEMVKAWIAIKSEQVDYAFEYSVNVSRMTSSVIPEGNLVDVASTSYAQSITRKESKNYTTINKNARGSNYKGKGRPEWALGKYQFMEENVFAFKDFLNATFKDYNVEQDFENDWERFISDEAIQDALFTPYNNKQVGELFTELELPTWDAVLDSYPQVSVKKSGQPPSIDFKDTLLEGKNANYTWENLARMYPWLQISGNKLIATTSVSGILGAMHLGGARLTANMLKGKEPAKDNLGTSIFDYLVIHGFRDVTIGKGKPLIEIIDEGGVVNRPEATDKPEQYKAETIQWAKPLANKIRAASSERGVPALAVAGAIIDEKDVYGLIDEIQDAVIDKLPEVSIRLDRAIGLDSKALNSFRNDLGPGNINLETATQLVELGKLTVPGSAKNDIMYTKIVDFLLSDKGTIETASAVIAQGKELFADVIGKLSEDLAEAVLIEYYKQGPSYHDRFRKNKARDPNHLPVPGDDGRQFLANRTRIMAILT